MVSVGVSVGVSVAISVGAGVSDCADRLVGALYAMKRDTSAITQSSARAICPPFGLKPFGSFDIAMARPEACFLAFILCLEVGHQPL